MSGRKEQILSGAGQFDGTGTAAGVKICDKLSSCGRSVGGPEFVTMDSVICCKADLIAQSGESGGETAGTAWPQVEDFAGCCTVGTPDFSAVGGTGREQEAAAECKQPSRHRNWVVERIKHLNSAGSCSVGCPECGCVARCAGGKIQPVTDRCQRARKRGAVTGGHVKQQLCSAGCAVGTPDFTAGIGKRGHEVDRIADHRQLLDIAIARTGDKIQHQLGSRGCSVTAPQLISRAGTVGDKQQRIIEGRQKFGIDAVGFQFAKCPRTGRRSIADPQSLVGCIGGAEVQAVSDRLQPFDLDIFLARTNINDLLSAGAVTAIQCGVVGEVQAVLEDHRCIAKAIRITGQIGATWKCAGIEVTDQRGGQQLASFQ